MCGSESEGLGRRWGERKRMYSFWGAIRGRESIVMVCLLVVLVGDLDSWLWCFGGLGLLRCLWGMGGGDAVGFAIARALD